MFSILLMACFDSTPNTTGAPAERSPVQSAEPVSAAPPVAGAPAPTVVPVSVEEFPAEDPAEGFARVTVRHGETLDGLARLAGTRPEAIAALNHFPVQRPLVPGEVIVVPDADTFDERRETALDERLFRFFEARGGMVGVSSRVVATGDTAWALAREEGVPLWVVAGLNRGRSLDSLSVGDELYFPLLGDTLVYPPEEGAVVEAPVVEGFPSLPAVAVDVPTASTPE